MLERLAVLGGALRFYAVQGDDLQSEASELVIQGTVVGGGVASKQVVFHRRSCSSPLWPAACPRKFLLAVGQATMKGRPWR
jgi:hypothetical protein